MYLKRHSISPQLLKGQLCLSEKGLTHPKSHATPLPGSDYLQNPFGLGDWSSRAFVVLSTCLVQNPDLGPQARSAENAKTYPCDHGRVRHSC